MLKGILRNPGENEHVLNKNRSVMKSLIPCVSLIILALISFSNSSAGQTVNCSDKYEMALQLYNYGMADSALVVLNPCLESKKELGNLSKEASADIYRLAALASIMKGEPGKAEEYVSQLLRVQPDYKHNFKDDDLMEFRLMVNSKLPQPSLRIGFSAGFNIPQLKLQKSYSDYETSFGEAYSLNETTGYQFGIVIENTLTRRISLELTAEIVQILFEYSVNGTLTTQYQYDQSIKYAQFPIVIKYYFTNGIVKPFVLGGAVGRISLNNIEKSETYGRYWFTESSNSDKILTTFPTDIEQVGLVLGGGIGCDFKKVNLRFDFRYNHNFKSGKTSEFDTISGYDDISPDEKFHYTDDINLIGLKYIQISIGLLYNLKYKVY